MRESRPKGMQDQAIAPRDITQNADSPSRGQDRSSAACCCSCSGRNALFGIVLALLVALWVAMSELLQGVQSSYPKPFAITWVIHVGYTIMLIPGLTLALRRYWAQVEQEQEANAKIKQEEKTTFWKTLDQYPVPFTQIVLLTFVFNWICCGIAYTW